MEGGLERRSKYLKLLKENAFDLVVVGGGITGAGVLREAALRGLRVALLERADFAWGTSSRSSKLIHGGLRYLENLHLHLVRESTTERARLMRLARHLVRPLPFILPVYRSSKHSLATLDLGLWLYDTLGGLKDPLHRRLRPDRLRVLEPAIGQDGLKGALLYYDAITDDARLTLETLLAAQEAGAVAASRCEVLGAQYRGGRVSSVRARDTLSGEVFEVSTGCIVCAAGPFTEAAMGVLDAERTSPRLRPTKGTHLVVPFERLPLSHAVVMTSPRDQRVMFAIPWHGATIIGTTDTDYTGDPKNVFADRWDVDYLLESVNAYCPSACLTPSDVIGTWAGLRPLIAPEPGKVLKESDVSREEMVTVDPRGVVAIAGGKLTTYRLMAIKAFKAALPFLDRARVRRRSGTDKLPLPYCGTLSRPTATLEQATTALADERGLPMDIATHLVQSYGVRASVVLEFAREEKSLADRIVSGLPFIWAEVVHACRNETALELEDVFCRRLPLFFLRPDQGLSVADDAANLMARELGWDEKTQQDQVARLGELAKAHTACLRSQASAV